MKTAYINIYGRIPSKKNSKRIVRNGGKTFVISSKNWMDFEKAQLPRIEALSNLKSPYKVDYKFYLKGKGNTDIDNMMAGINDLFEKAGVIDNDKNILHVTAEKIIGADEYKAEVTIFEVE